ncbi:hypothetical protein BDV95DRAFT_481463 [Massariosphaeria phaeospora]|uniref:Glycosyl transferase CAP10 domain-containing protein n=1 Tax=Massariosphaeria phaeospora TaxID=100035 RepID=A0A7C8MK50_9PLEO|nr:hypothetical protein BDV95DRAFT_481463 [Massariosphaeria phaeospora]
MDRKALFYPCGLILGTSYLATTQHASFAFDRPLHTFAVVLLLAGLAIVAYEACTAKTRRPALIARYVAIPLSDGNGRSSDEILAPPQHPRVPTSLGVKALAGLVTALMFTICVRAAIYYRVMKHIECTGPSALAFLPLVLAVHHSSRYSRSSSWNSDPPPTAPLEYLVHFAFHGTTRYILPAFLLSISSFLTTWKTSALQSTYICPLSNSAASTIPKLQFLGFLFDCTVALVLYNLIDDGVAQTVDNAVELSDRATNNVLIGLTFTASSLVLAVAGIAIYAALPEHRQWILAAPPEYLQGLLRLSLMIPLTTLCFLVTVRMYGVMGAVFILAFSAAYIGVLRALGTGVSYSFPPKPTVGLILCLILLTIALILSFVVDTNSENRVRPKMHVRLGRPQMVVFVFVLLVFSFGVAAYRYQPPFPGHPVTTLIRLANEQHYSWSSQARRSKTLAEAVRNYQSRYGRDPPPSFDKWYEYATGRNSMVIDDFDNVEEDLAPFASLSPVELRQRTLEILADANGLGGISIRQGKAAVLGEVPGTHRWMVDGTIQLIEKFVSYLPDMDFAINLNDECRVAPPYAVLLHTYTKGALEFEKRSSNPALNFSTDRASTWPNIGNIPGKRSHFENHSLQPTFQTYGSVACAPDSLARREREWNTRSLCTACAAPHSMGIFVANWTLSAYPCHQPDLANLHGLHLSPAALHGTHDLVPVFSQSRAPGYVDIRFPSPWNYMGKSSYQFDEKNPDPSFVKKENTLFWRGATSEGVSAGSGAWKGMLRQRLVHLLNNNTGTQPILLPKGKDRSKIDYVIENTATIKRLLETKVDARFVGQIVRCGGVDCTDQTREFGLANAVDFKQHWRYRFLFDADGAGFSGRFIPFLQSNSVVFKAALFREWYEGRLFAWKHFVPVDLRLHDLFSLLAYFGGYGVDRRDKRMMEPREKEAEDIARAGKVWTEKVLRKEDMEIYMFRLLLEWGRLTDDRREEVGFRLEGRDNG